MAQGKGTIEAHVSFAVPGDKIELHVRAGDTPAPGEKPVKTAKVRKDGFVKFEDVPLGPYFLIGYVEGVRDGQKVKELRGEAINCKVEPPAPVKTSPPITDPALQAQLRAQTSTEIVTGARTTANSRPRNARGHTPPVDPLAHPEEAQLVAEKGAQLASDTFAGEAVPAAEQPVQQGDVKKGTPQASSTELGDAAVIEERPEEPPLGDIDPDRASGDSALGPAGTVSPADAGKKPPVRQKREDEAKAEKRAKASKKAAATRRRKAAPKGANAKAAARSAAAKKAAATRKRNAAKK